MLRMFLITSCMCMYVQSVRAVDLVDFVSAAISQNYALQSAAQNVESQKLQWKLTRGRLLPSLSVSMSTSYSNNITKNIGAADNVDRSRQSNASFSLSQSILNVGQWLSLKGAKIDQSGGGMDDDMSGLG